MNKDNIVFGLRVKNVVSGLEGIVTGKADYFTGCTRFFVEEKGTAKKPGKKDDWVDYPLLEKVEEGDNLIEFFKNNPNTNDGSELLNIHDGIVLGNEVKDIVTGFKGYASAAAIHATGCVRVRITKKMTGNQKKPEELLWFDDLTLEKVSDGLVKTKIKEKIETGRNGGPQEDPPGGPSSIKG